MGSSLGCLDGASVGAVGAVEGSCTGCSSHTGIASRMLTVAQEGCEAPGSFLCASVCLRQSATSLKNIRCY